MSRRARQRAHHPRRAGALNAVEIAINGARRLSDDDVQGRRRLLERARREMACGVQWRLHWGRLADAANMAETFAAMGLGSGPDAERVITAAQRALHDAHVRHAERGSCALYADEIDALDWLVRVHVLQLASCSYSEFAAAYDRTRERISQAMAGNATPGACVVVGLVGSQRPEPSATP